jgi:hypothetical protein
VKLSPDNLFIPHPYKILLSQGYMGAPLYYSTGQVGPWLGNSGPLMEWKWCHYVIFEAAILLKLLPTSKLDIYKVIEPLECFVKGLWVHPYTIPPAKLAPDWGILGRLWSGNDAITSWLRLTLYSNCFPHPYKTYTKCLSTLICCP